MIKERISYYPIYCDRNSSAKRPSPLTRSVISEPLLGGHIYIVRCLIYVTHTQPGLYKRRLCYIATGLRCIATGLSGVLHGVSCIARSLGCTIKGLGSMEKRPRYVVGKLAEGINQFEPRLNSKCGNPPHQRLLQGKPHLQPEE